MTNKYTVKVTRIEKIAKDTKAFTLEKPDDYKYKAGQFFQVALHGVSGLPGNDAAHMFSIASAPHERELLFATRMRTSDYKQALDKVNIGDTLEISEAEGDFILHDDTSIPVVLLTGGIGMTTGISILKDAAFHDKKYTITAIDSNTMPDDAPFLYELQELNRKMKNLSFIETMTKIDSSDIKWDGETGVIDRSILDKYVNDLHGSQYYLVGPPGLIEHLEGLLKETKIDEGRITKESYSGY